MMYTGERPVYGLKVRYIGKGKGSLLKGKIYDVIAIHDETNSYRLIDESGEDYMFSDIFFEVVQGSADPPVAHSAGQVPPAG
jgi:hypothetical protein